MADLIQIPARPAYRETTLAELWAEAETLGRVSVSSYGRDYIVTVMFHTRRGSTVFAKGEHASIACAVGLAINEAREFGAGSPG